MNEQLVYKVVETLHESSNSENIIAQFATRHEALIASAKALKANLTELSQPGLGAGDLFAKWKTSGKGFRIAPEDSPAPFSDLDFARLFVLRLTNDYSHPLFIEVSTVDCLRTASGVQSPAKNWKFWVKAPVTYSDGDLSALIRVATEVLYDEMSEQSLQADGSSYVLLDLSFRSVADGEASASINGDRSATVYFVQNDGSFRKSRPTNPSPVAAT